MLPADIVGKLVISSEFANKDKPNLNNTNDGVVLLVAEHEGIRRTLSMLDEKISYTHAALQSVVKDLEVQQQQIIELHKRLSRRPAPNLN